MKSNFRIQNLVLIIGAGATLSVMLTGCGQDDAGSPKFALKGNITYDGKPLPAGEIRMDPDSSKGNSGPAAFAEIKDGKYELGGESGHIGGPHRVVIRGNDGKPGDAPDGTPMPQGVLLFQSYETEADLPKESGQALDFDVPKQ